MRLRTFHGATMAEAMRKVRESMSAEAVIVSTCRGKRGQGVRITAAVEAPEDDHAHHQIPAIAVSALELPIAQALAYHGVPAPLDQRLCRAAAGRAGDDTVTALAAALALSFTFAPLAESGAPLLLMGPPGAGKTVTTAKLATRMAMAGATVKVITTDTTRAGGVDQLAAFTRILGERLITAATPADLREELASGADAVVTLVDTAGTNVFNPDEMAVLRGFIEDVDIEPVLVLPAGGDAAESAELAEVFASIGARRMIATRLDAARRIGALLAAADAARIAFSDFSATPFVGQGLEAVDPDTLARLLLHDPTRPKVRSELDKVAR